VQQFKAKETPILRLVSDAFLTEARKQNPATDVALSVSGYTRDTLWKGQKGDISLADIFRILSLGASPTDGTLAHPMILVGLSRDELKGLLELTGMSYLREDSVDYYTLPAGMYLEFNPSLITDPTAPNSITKIRYAHAANNDVCDGDVLYDSTKTTNGGYLPDGYGDATAKRTVCKGPLCEQ